MRVVLIGLAVVSWCGVIRTDNISESVRPGSGKPKFDETDWELSKAMGIVTKKYENVVISPISLRVVLGLLMDAADGMTAQEIGKLLKFDVNDKQKIRENYHDLLKSLKTSPNSLVTSDVETRIFADHTVKLNETYFNILKDYYNTGIDKVDFTQISEVINKINSWAEGATHGHIRDLISQGDTDSNAVMLLLNVIFFNGVWTNPFDEKETKTERFYLNDKQFVQADMMKASHELEYAQTFDKDLQLLRLPYQGGSFAMYFILPRSRTGLEELISNVTPAKVHSLMKTMQPAHVNLTIPRFKFSYNIGLKPVLEKYGITTMFGPAADFSHLESNSTTKLFVSNILQKAGIEVNEKGSTAYASTVAEIQNKFGGEETFVEFKADKPFLFFIEEDKSRTVVFVGKVTNPGPVTSQPANNQIGAVSPLSATSDITEREKDFNKQSSDIFDKDFDKHSIEWKRLSYFDTELLENLCHNNKGKNIVLSPASVKLVLGLLLEGATGNTATELQRTLHLSENITIAQKQLHQVHRGLKRMAERFPVSEANAVFLSNTIQPKQEFTEVAKTKYDAVIEKIDTTDTSGSIQRVNNWVKTKTNGLIPTILNQGMIKQNTKLVLVNAMYFKAKWLYEFPKEATRPQEFYVSNSQTKCVQMMTMKASLKQYYDKEINANIVQIPFKNHRYILAIILPKNKGAIESLENDLKRLSIVDLLHDYDSLEVTLSIPRFSAEFEAQLPERLKELRLTQIFSDNAELYNLAQGNNTKLKVDEIVHKAFIKIDEEGAEAAAATASSVVPLSYPGGAEKIVVDHPFLFFIYHTSSKMVLFEGKINQPTEINKAECDAAKRLPPIESVLDRIYNIDIRTGSEYSKNKPQSQMNLPGNQVFSNGANKIVPQPASLSSSQLRPQNTFYTQSQQPSLIENKNKLESGKYNYQPTNSTDPDAISYPVS